MSFSVLKVLGTDNNKEKREATTTVQAYPTQFVLSPKETKSVRVRYMNKNLPNIEEVYRIVAQELDIDVGDDKQEDTKGKIKAQIKMRFSYEGLLFIKQENAKEKLDIQSIQNTNNTVSIVIINNGNASAIPLVKKYNFIVTLKDGKEYPLIPEDLKGAEFRRVLAGKTNTFTLKNITSVAVDKITSMRLEKK